MSSDATVPGLIKTYFWMVHYDFSPDVQTQSANGLTPIPAGKKVLGVTPHHRRSFEPVRLALSGPADLFALLESQPLAAADD